MLAEQCLESHPVQRGNQCEAGRCILNNISFLAAWVQASGLAGIIQSALRNLDLSADESAALLLDTAAQQQPLLQRLRQAVGVSSGLQCDDDADALAAQLLELSSRLPAAAKLADVLHECFQPAMQPEWHVDAQLALAQAAATRSCAYLRCANLGGEGGPATGQGVGSMRCRWAGGLGVRLRW